MPSNIINKRWQMNYMAKGIIWMRQSRMLQILLLALAGFLTSLPANSSSSRFEIHVKELNSKQPVFTFSKSLFVQPRWTKSSVNLNSVQIVAKRGNEWDYKKPVWAFELAPGEGQEVNRIKYGITPPKFTQTVAAKPLITGESYMVLIYGLGSSGSKEFALTENSSDHQTK